MQRTCPRDHTPLVAEKMERVTVDLCPKCGGAFFDKGELGRVVDDKELKRYLDMAHGSATSPLVCPACAGLMDLDKVDDVELDHCMQCHGVWLDGSELERISQRDPEAPLDGTDEKRRAMEDRRYAAMPRGGGGGRFGALGDAVRSVAWKLRRRK